MPEGFSGLSFQADLWIPLAMLSVDSPVSLLIVPLTGMVCPAGAPSACNGRPATALGDYP